MEAGMSGKSAVVTGAATGIGRALVEAMEKHGMNILAVDVDRHGLEKLQSESGANRQISVMEADVRNAASMMEAADRAVAEFGSLDVWVNNAGLARHKPVDQISAEEVDLVIDVNLKGTIYGSKAAMQHMKSHGRGHIVNIISTASLRGVPTESVYCSAKWGVRGFTQALQEEGAAAGIRVTAVLPGGVETGFWKDARQGTTAMENFLKPTDVASAVMQCLGTPVQCVVREVVVRSMSDTDFAYREG